MKQTKLIMGMPITIEVVGEKHANAMTAAFKYFRAVDKRFSTYKPNSEISRVNNGLAESDWSNDMRRVLSLCEQTRRATNGYFDITHNGRRDPSGLVKGWAIEQAARQLEGRGIDNFYIEAGGDIEAHGVNQDGQPWIVGIRNPFAEDEIIKVLHVSSHGVATSGTYARDQHIYNPFQPEQPLEDIRSLTVVGRNIYEADRFATAAFAMGRAGIDFIESKPGLEGYMVDNKKMATYTSGFEKYVANG